MRLLKNDRCQELRPQMDARPGNVTGWKLGGQGQDNHGWPLAMKPSHDLCLLSGG
jgi:hypothetical protein